MKGFFSEDNKFMQVLLTIGDLIMLNVLFLLCCLPVVTIGAAQAGLYTGLRVMSDKEDDSSCAAAFFRGFTNGFGKITVAFVILLVMIVFAVWFTLAMLAAGQTGFSLIMSVIAIGICCVFQAQLSAFHSRFSCSFSQLFRNAWVMVLMHPLRAIALGLLTWSPLWLFLFTSLSKFLALAPLFLSVFFSLVHLLGNKVMGKPFEALVEKHENNIREATAEQ